MYPFYGYLPKLFCAILKVSNSTQCWALFLHNVFFLDVKVITKKGKTTGRLL